MPLAVRRATPADAAVIMEFSRLLAEESEGKTLDRRLLAVGVAAGLADPGKALYFLAEEDGHVLGQTMITFEWCDWRNGWFWWVQGVYVRADARRRGVFRALYEHVREQAKQTDGVVGLRLYVEPANHVAQKTYERLGFVPAGYLLLEQYPL